MPTSDYAGKTVAEILKTKRGAIKNAPLEPGSPSWVEILHLTWEEIEDRQRDRKPGFKTFHKLFAGEEV